MGLLYMQAAAAVLSDSPTIATWPWPQLGWGGICYTGQDPQMNVPAGCGKPYTAVAAREKPFRT